MSEQQAIAPAAYPEPGGRYRHYKGGDYIVVGLGKHSETDETGVIYRSVQFGSLHFRPIEEWNKPVEGSEYKRFEMLGMTQPNR